jgi:S-DNA-T family DNA segregation ATPase FtsK/SpoIIIE
MQGPVGMNSVDIPKKDAGLIRDREGLDRDIKRLLHAAGEDAESNSDAEAKNPVEPVSHGSPVDGNESSSDKTIPATSHEKSRSGTSDVISDIEPLNINQKIEEKKTYVFPSIDLLNKPKTDSRGMSDRDLKETALKLQKTLDSFGVKVTITNVSCGPAVTRYELQPEQGVKVSKITGLSDDIKLNLAAALNK